MKRDNDRRVAMRGQTMDRTVSLQGPEKRARIDLGLQISRRFLVPGDFYTRDELAEFCGCTDAAIYQIEKSALRKLRKALGISWGEIEELFASRHVARATRRHQGGLC